MVVAHSVVTEVGSAPVAAFDLVNAEYPTFPCYLTPAAYEACPAAVAQPRATSVYHDADAYHDGVACL